MTYNFIVCCTNHETVEGVWDILWIYLYEYHPMMNTESFDDLSIKITCDF